MVILLSTKYSHLLSSFRTKQILGQLYGRVTRFGFLFWLLLLCFLGSCCYVIHGYPCIPGGFRMSGLRWWCVAISALMRYGDHHISSNVCPRVQITKLILCLPLPCGYVTIKGPMVAALSVQTESVAILCTAGEILVAIRKDNNLYVSQCEDVCHDGAFGSAR